MRLYAKLTPKKLGGQTAGEFGISFFASKVTCVENWLYIALQKMANPCYYKRLFEGHELWVGHQKVWILVDRRLNVDQK